MFYCLTNFPFVLVHSFGTVLAEIELFEILPNEIWGIFHEIKNWNIKPQIWIVKIQCQEEVLCKKNCMILQIM